MISLADLHKAPTLLRHPVYRSYMEILLGRRQGKCHSRKILAKLKAHRLVDSTGKPTLIGIQALDTN